MAEKKKDVTESTEIVVVEVTEELLREKLYEVRGVKVSLIRIWLKYMDTQQRH